MLIRGLLRFVDRLHDAVQNGRRELCGSRAVGADRECVLTRAQERHPLLLPIVELQGDDGFFRGFGRRRVYKRVGARAGQRREQRVDLVGVRILRSRCRVPLFVVGLLDDGRLSVPSDLDARGVERTCVEDVLLAELAGALLKIVEQRGFDGEDIGT